MLYVAVQTAQGFLPASAWGRIPGEILGVANVDGEFLDDLVIAETITKALLVAQTGPAAGFRLPVLGLESFELPDCGFFVADVDGDARADLLWYVASPNVAGWHMLRSLGNADDNAIRFAGTVGHSAEFYPAALDWCHIAALSDLQGDGLLDLVTAAPTSALFQVGTAAQGAFIEQELRLNVRRRPGWREIAGGDFNGDGVGDLLIRDVVSGELFIGYSESGAGLPHGGPGSTSAPDPFRGSAVQEQLGDGALHGFFPAFQRFPPFPHPLFPGHTVKHDMDDAWVRGPVKFSWVLTQPFPAAAFGRSVPIWEDTPGPYACVGYHPQRIVSDVDPFPRKWGAPITGNCPDGYAYYSAADFPLHVPATELAFQGVCCRLPADEILVSEHVISETECPDGYVATGTARSGWEAGSVVTLRCTRINQERYLLGPELPARYWGYGFTARMEPSRLRKEEIPLAIRHAVGRRTFYEWADDGCVTFPWGSLLVAKTDQGQGCARLKARQLLYRGVGSDPPRATPVTMFPSCGAIDYVFSPNAGCVLEETPGGLRRPDDG